MVLATVITIVNYDRKTFIVQATAYSTSSSVTKKKKRFIMLTPELQRCCCWRWGVWRRTRKSPNCFWTTDCCCSASAATTACWRPPERWRATSCQD